MYKRLLQIIITFSLAGMIMSCSDSSTSVNPEPDPNATTGAIEITTKTTGNGTNEDGYEISLKDSTKAIDINGSVKFEDLEEKTHIIKISGIGTGCVLDGNDQVSLNVVAGETTSAIFKITCNVSTAKGIIVFAQTVDRTEQIFSMKADGSDQKQLTTSKFANTSPAVSPDGKQIVFERVDENSPNLFTGIWVMDIDGGNVQNVSNNNMRNSRPAWSPNGTQIAWETGQESLSIFRMNADGSNQTQITDDNGNDHSVTWSGKNNVLAFVSNRKEEFSANIYTINPDGTNLKLLIEPDANAFNPAWSPDGSKIAYEGTDSKGSSKVFTATADGSNIKMIQSNGYSNARQPSWSPDGNFITFLERAGGTGPDAIWIVEINTSIPFKLTDDQATKLQYPTWGAIAH